MRERQTFDKYCGPRGGARLRGSGPHAQAEYGPWTRRCETHQTLPCGSRMPPCRSPYGMSATSISRWNVIRPPPGTITKRARRRRRRYAQRLPGCGQVPRRRMRARKTTNARSENTTNQPTSALNARSPRLLPTLDDPEPTPSREAGSTFTSGASMRPGAKSSPTVLTPVAASKKHTPRRRTVPTTPHAPQIIVVFMLRNMSAPHVQGDERKDRATGFASG